MPTSISTISERLQFNLPIIQTNPSGNEAATCMLVKERNADTEILFIERARCENDPWSGQMALPGGRREPEDRTVLETALRETQEEVGINATVDNCIGRLDDIVTPETGPGRGIVVSCHVVWVAEVKQSIANYEVSDALWVPVSFLLNPNNFVSEYKPPNYSGTFPGFRVNNTDNRVIWGLTYRFLRSFFKSCGLPSPKCGDLT